MPMFFALAGLFAGKWVAGSWRDVLSQKVILFVWVLVLWSFVDMAVQIAGLVAAGHPINVRAVVRDLALCLLNPLFELWFIWALAIFFVIAKLTRRANPVVQLVLAGAISATALTIWLTATTMSGPIGILKYYFFFLLGLLMRSAVIGFANSPLWTRVAVLFAWAAVSTVLYTLDWRAVPGVYFMNCLLGVLGGVSLATFLAACAPLRGLGRNTLPIYLAHTPVAVLASIVLLVVPGFVAFLAPVSAMVPPVIALIAVGTSLALHRVALRCRLRYLYQAPSRLVSFAGSQRLP